MNLQLSVHQPLDQFELHVDASLQRPIVGIFGSSGAGKSSLLRAIAGLTRQVSGRIAFGDSVWLDSAAGTWCPAERRNIGYVPQAGLLFPNRSVRQNILSGARRAKRNGQDPERLLAESVAVLELGGVLHRRVSALSGGERQRVSLARALCSGPRLLLLDEPLASLDRRLRWRILPLLKQAYRRFSLPMLLVSHDKIEIQALCDEVLVLDNGAVVRSGSPAAVFSGGAAYRGSYLNVFVATPAAGRLRISDTLSLPALSSEGHAQATLVGISARDIHLGRGALPATITARSEREVLLHVDDEMPTLVAEHPGGQWAVGQRVSIWMDPERWILMDR